MENREIEGISNYLKSDSLPLLKLEKNLWISLLFLMTLEYDFANFRLCLFNSDQCICIRPSLRRDVLWYTNVRTSVSHVAL